jgi:hypothetical protein
MENSCEAFEGELRSDDVTRDAATSLDATRLTIHEMGLSYLYSRTFVFAESRRGRP